MLATKLSRALVAPSKVANILDWRKAFGSVMALDITRERIGLAVAEHPDLQARHGLEPLALEPMSLKRDRGGRPRGRVDGDLVSELEAAVRRHHVCAFVVNWPVQEGRTGERCGRVLRVLDSVVDQSNRLVTSKRPFALWWDPSNASSVPSPPDEWGRSADFARLPEYFPGMSYSSKSGMGGDSSEDASAVAAHVLDGWVKNHWDVGRTGKADAAFPPKEKRDLSFGTNWTDEYGTESASLQAALL